jgi:hypothetical protein
MTTTAKAYKGMGMEGSTARWYDRTTRKDMPEIKALGGPHCGNSSPVGPGARGSAGPGISLHRTGQARPCRCARSISAKPLWKSPGATQRQEGVAALRAGQRRGPAGGRRQRGLCRLPCSLQELHRAGQGAGEMRRVLRPGGVALLIDMRRDASLSEIKRYVDGLGVSR